MVRSVSREELRRIAHEGSERLFESEDWIRLLMAADNSRKPQQILNGRYQGGIARGETDKLREMLEKRRHNEAKRE